MHIWQTWKTTITYLILQTGLLGVMACKCISKIPCMLSAGKSKLQCFRNFVQSTTLHNDNPPKKPHTPKGKLDTDVEPKSYYGSNVLEGNQSVL